MNKLEDCRINQLPHPKDMSCYELSHHEYDSQMRAIIIKHNELVDIVADLIQDRAVDD